MHLAAFDVAVLVKNFIWGPFKHLATGIKIFLPCDICALRVYHNIFLQFGTGKSLSEAPLFAEHAENMLCTKIVLNVKNNFCTQHVLPRFDLGIFMYWTCNSMNNLSSYCGLCDAKIGLLLTKIYLYRHRQVAGLSYNRCRTHTGVKSR